MNVVRNASKNIIFIRHGQSLANVAQVDDPSVIDALLTELGRNQAESWSDSNAVRELLESVEICLCSPLRRAMETAALVFKNTCVPIHINRYAREKYWYLWQCRGVSHEETVEHSKRLCREIGNVESLSFVDKHWNPEEENAAISNKTPNSFQKLSKESIQMLSHCLMHHQSTTIAVTCHWGVIEALLGIECTNCELVVTQLDTNSGTFQVVERLQVPDNLLSGGDH